MVRILGNNLANRKKVYVALTCIYGVGVSRSKKILCDLGINEDKRVSDLTEENISKLRDLLESDEFQLEGNLRRFLKLNITHLVEINSFKGKRHLKGLPVRGQRTRTNSRTARKLTIFKRKK